MDNEDWKMIGMIFGLIVLGIIGFGLVVLLVYWLWMLMAMFVGALLGALVGAFVHGYHLFM